MVVIDHFYNKQKLKPYLYILYYHIPCFFFLSFFFTYRTFISLNIDKIKLRFERLLIPYFSWNFLSWIIRNIYYYMMKRKCDHSLIDFIKTLINGHIFNVVLWFQNILILLTLIFLIIIFLFKSYHLIIFQLLFFTSYILQYSGANYIFFKNNFAIHSRLTLGRFFEAIPHSITGMYLSRVNVMKYITKKKMKTFIQSLIILILITKYEIFAKFNNYKYGGLRLNIGAVCIFIIFSLIPEKIFIINLKSEILMKLTKYTGGIYFTHYLIGTGYICSSINLIKKRTILGCMIIHLMSYIASVIGFKLLGNTKFKNLFI